MVDGGLAAGKAFSDEYRANRYHQPADEWEASWNFTGLARDLKLLYTVGRELANSERWPNWSTDPEFRPARDANAAERERSVPSSEETRVGVECVRTSISKLVP